MNLFNNADNPGIPSLLLAEAVDRFGGVVCNHCGLALGRHEGWFCPEGAHAEVVPEPVEGGGTVYREDAELNEPQPIMPRPSATEINARIEAMIKPGQTFALPSNTKDTNPKDAIGCKKAPMSTLPAGVIAEMGVAMLEGKAKYGAFNYRVAGVRASVYYDALMRHIMAWWEGEDIDPDSGMPHVVKALSTLVVLRDAQRNGMVTDDRPPISHINYGELNAKSASIIETHSDKAPRHYTRDDKIGGQG